MAGANRYTRLGDFGQVRGPEYIPQPFNNIAAVGEAKQGQYDQAVQQEGAIAALQAKVKPLDEVYGYGPNGLSTYKTGQSQEVQSYFDNLRKDLSTKADEIAKGDKGSSEYRGWLKNKANEVAALTSPTGKFGQYTQDAENYTKQQEEISKNPDVEKAGWLANKAYSNVGDYLKGKARISLQTTGKFVNRDKELDDLTKGINEELTSLYASPTGQGYIASGKKEEITRKKVADTFQGFFPNSETAKDLHDEISHKIKSGELDPANAETYFNTHAKYIEDALISKYTKSTGSASLTSDATGLQKEKEIKEKERLKGMSIEGNTMDLLGQGAKTLKDKGVFKDDGTIDWTAVDEKVTEGGGLFGSGLTTGGGGAKTKIVSHSKELHEEINKMATALGYDIDKISAKNGDYDRIFKEFNEFSKTRGFDVQLTPATSESISSYINKGGINNYTIQANGEGEYKDLDKLDGDAKSLVTNPDTHIQVVNRRDADGKMVYEGVVTGKDGEHLGKVNLRPKAKEETNYFDKVSSVQQQALDYMTTKKINYQGKEDNLELRKELGSSIMNRLKQNPDLYNTASSLLDTDSPILISEITLPTGKTLSTFANPKVPSKQMYMDDGGNIYSSMGDVKTSMDAEFYSTPSGGAFRPEAEKKTTLPIENIRK